MKILTVSATPYILTRLGRINSSILKALKEDGHEVASACYHHDPTWFVPDENNKFFYEEDGDVICQLFPFAHIGEKSSPALYEIVKHYQPDIVISIGDYDEVDFIYALKALNPDSFKWVSILTCDASPINTQRKKAFEYIDSLISVSKFGLEEALRFMPSDRAKYVPFGVSDDFSNNRVETLEVRKLRVMNASKNSQSSNLGCFFRAIQSVQSLQPEISAYLHTNINDIGDHDIYELIDRYNIKINLPEKFTGINDGISNSDLNNIYNSYDVIVDTSVKSATGLHVLEAMSTGCIPIVSDIPIYQEILEDIPNGWRFLIDGNYFLGKWDEEYNFSSYKDLSKTLLYLNHLREKDFHQFCAIKDSVVKIAEKYKIGNFLENIKETVNIYKNNINEIKIESL